MILTGRNPERLKQAALDVEARSTAAFDATDPAALHRFFAGLPDPIDHVLVTAGGPHYGPLLEMDSAQVRQALGDHVALGLDVARNAAGKMRAGGALLLMGGTGGRRIGHGLGIASAATSTGPRSWPPSPSSSRRFASISSRRASRTHRSLWASILGDELEARRDQLRATLPIRRVVGPADIAALAVHLMINTALTGATYDIDGGQQFVE